MPRKLSHVPYRHWARWTDWYHGWRDGRQGVPERPGAPGPISTPRREALIRYAQEAFEHEHLAYLSMVADAHRRIMAERSRLAAAQSAVTTAEAEFRQIPGELPEAVAKARRFGEVHQPESVVTRRRRKEHQELRTKVRSILIRARAEAAAVDADLAAALQEAKQHHDAAVARVVRMHEHIHRRLAVYRRSLIRSHQEGAWVNGAMSALAPEIPGWAQPHAYPPEGAPKPLPPVPDDVVVIPDETLPPAELIELGFDETHFGSTPPKPGSNIGFVKLNNPFAAVWHFTIVKRGDQLELRTRGHGHGPFMSGEPVSTAVLRSGDQFDFGGFRYIMLDRNELLKEPLGQSSLVAYDLHAASGDKPRLSGMSFIQRKGKLLAVLGPSGAGKSSLCLALLGELPLQSGSLFFGPLSMATHSQQIRDNLGFVPQDTKLHDSLTVEATLRYGYSLRNSNRGGREQRISKVLADTKLAGQRSQRLCTLSGGQLRRVSIALELLTDPELFMLDEPTSGLDASMDRQIMDILRSYAGLGNTVIVVTHATEHLWKADQLLVVIDGGTPVYAGPPRPIRKHFNFKVYAELMSLLLDEQRRATFVEQYRVSEQVKEAQREAARLEQADTRALPPGARLAHAARSFRDPLRQFGVLVRRQVALLATRALRDNDRSAWRSAKNGVIVALPLLIAIGWAALAALVAGPPGLGAKPSQVGPTALALLTTLCVLSGQALTYSDVVNEIDVIRREYRAGIGVVPVLTAKWLVYAVLAIAQAALITAVFCAIPQRAPQRSVFFGPEADLFIGLAALSVAAMTLGMLISTLASKLEHAVALVTATSIAQIALNGVTSDLSKPSITSVLAGLLPDRWGLAAAASSVDLRGIDEANRALASNDALWTHSAGQWLQDLAAMSVLAAVFFALAAFRLNRKLRPN